MSAKKYYATNLFRRLFPRAPLETIDVWAMCYERISDNDLDKSITGGKITDLHTGESWETDENGYAYINVQKGRKITLAFDKVGYARVQTATVIVPKGGLKGQFNELSFQTPSIKLYNLLKTGLGHPQPGCSHIVTTIQPDGHNMHRDKGVEGARVFLCDKKNTKIEAQVYLGQIFNEYSEWVAPILALKLAEAGDNLGKTDNKFLKSLSESLKNFSSRIKYRHTSKDGAAIFLNVPKGEYVITAQKDGMRFSKALVEVLDGSPEFINVAPPQSPHEIAILSKKPLTPKM